MEAPRRPDQEESEDQRGAFSFAPSNAPIFSNEFLREKDELGPMALDPKDRLRMSLTWFLVISYVVLLAAPVLDALIRDRTALPQAAKDARDKLEPLVIVAIGFFFGSQRGS